MKKSLLILMSIISLNVFSQSFTLTPEDNPVIGSPTDFDIFTKITVRNNTSENLSLKASRQAVSISQGTSNYFCWDVCYGDTFNTSVGVINFEPGEIDNSSFSVHFRPNGSSSVSVIKYCVYNLLDVSDSSCVNVSFSTETTDISSDENRTFSQFFPNPTTGLTSLDYSINYGDELSITVGDMLGNIVADKSFVSTNGKVSFDLSIQRAGLYFANIVLNGELKSVERIVITD